MILARVSPISSEVVRFAAVGLSATFVYFLSYNAVSYGTAASPIVANVVAFALSLTLSYFGHKHVTFRAGGGNAVYLPRFVAITLLLVLATSIISTVATSWLHLPSYMVAALVSVSYPLGSFFLNKFWVFGD
jgi:putative flippase GtrA